MLASCWPMWSQKIRKMGTAKNRCKTLCWPILGLCWPILGLCWPILGLCWPILELCWPILGLCWPILGAMLAHLEAMLVHLEAYVGPCWPISSHKIRKMGKHVECHRAKKHCKLQGFLSTRAPYQRSAAGAAAPLSYGEERNAYGYATARGPWPDLSAYARQPARGPTMLAHLVARLAYVGRCWPMLT